ncbi:LysR family transcriptional regulator [Comamonas piscis]|uniref:LysR family transcriptional regulator n=1 Tax=Comamonas piscis TaxID=1562974 RepID=A0A7G5EFF1_9BURK|nr:LysR family transcriptional regulator [Comamonas piscis]QMV72726.1 LysR family transcriptional regulator [Comamonas piscis]WSO35500.1 LysR family transcriptional regulator [Comamonas piscis]
MQKANNLDEAALGNFSHLKRLAYFSAVVETGSFTAAAERLGITKAVVSQQVAKLEADFSTSLLTRSTRKVVPTEAGQAFYQRCAFILKEAAEAFDELSQSAQAPSGTLRLTAPLDYGIAAIVPAITAFCRRYPQCKVDASLSDQSLDLMDGQVELAIRVGWLTELHLQARQIGSFRQLLVASPSWSPQLADVQEPQQLSVLPFVANTALRDPLHWSFSRNALERQNVSMPSVLSLNATMAVREAVRHGAGLSVLPDYAVADDLHSGRLVQVLPDWKLPSGGIHAVFPAARFRPVKVRAFVELLQQQLAQQGEEVGSPPTAPS